MSFNIYLVNYMGMPSNYHAIFVETYEDRNKTRYLYQVTGNIQTGMIQSPPLSSRDLLFYHQKLQVTLQSLPTSPPNY
ncbi:hypothetical protein BDZ45DRAFT_608527 [Acephala macrosclerotiorum]|nr:hypothetical protein BDZ45DRAFT_608527 [Acephala macrosclerotiorum]